MNETDGQVIKGNLLYSTDHSHFLCLAILITVTIRAHHFLSETHSCFLLARVKFKLPSLDLAQPTLSLVAIRRSAPSALDRKRLLWVPGQQRRWQHERLVLGVGALTIQATFPGFMCAFTHSSPALIFLSHIPVLQIPEWDSVQSANSWSLTHVTNQISI